MVSVWIAGSASVGADCPDLASLLDDDLGVLFIGSLFAPQALRGKIPTVCSMLNWVFQLQPLLKWVMVVRQTPYLWATPLDGTWA